MSIKNKQSITNIVNSYKCGSLHYDIINIGIEYYNYRVNVWYNLFVSMLHIGWIKNAFDVHKTHKRVVVFCNMILKHKFYAMVCTKPCLQ